MHQQGVSNASGAFTTPPCDDCSVLAKRLRHVEAELRRLQQQQQQQPRPRKLTPSSASALRTGPRRAVRLWVTPSELQLSLARYASCPQAAAHVHLAASSFFYDLFHGRSLLHSCSVGGLAAYRFVHKGPWKVFVRMVGWLHLLLAFLEPPSSLQWPWASERAAAPIGPSRAVCACLELVCLGVYLTHALLQYRAYGAGRSGYWRSGWRRTKALVLLLSFVDVLLLLTLGPWLTSARAAPSSQDDADIPAQHLSQLLRVFFVLEQSARMRHLSTALLFSLPSLLSIQLLCGVHVSIFSVLGFLVIGPLEGGAGSTAAEQKQTSPEAAAARSYDTIAHSFRSTLILLTSANFPSVAMPAYRHHWLSILFFVAFLIIGLYLLLPLTIAVMFDAFQTFTRRMLLKTRVHERQALQAAFQCMRMAGSEEADVETRRARVSRLSMHPASSEAAAARAGVRRNVWVAVLAKHQPRWTAEQSAALFDAHADAIKAQREQQQLHAHDPPAADLSSASAEYSASALHDADSAELDFHGLEQLLLYIHPTVRWLKLPLVAASSGGGQSSLPAGASRAINLQEPLLHSLPSSSHSSGGVVVAVEPRSDEYAESSRLELLCGAIHCSWLTDSLRRYFVCELPLPRLLARGREADSRRIEEEEKQGEEEDVQAAYLSGDTHSAVTDALNASQPASVRMFSLHPQPAAAGPVAGHADAALRRESTTQVSCATTWHAGPGQTDNKGRSAAAMQSPSLSVEADTWAPHRGGVSLAATYTPLADVAPPERTPLQTAPARRPARANATFVLSELMADALTLLHSLLHLLVVLLSAESTESEALSCVAPLRSVVLLLQVLFALELVCKLAVYPGGPRALLASDWHKLDAFCIGLGWLAQMAEWGFNPSRHSAPAALLTSARLARVLRFTYRLPALQLLLRVLVRVAPAISGMVGVLLLVLFSYGVLGCWLFSGLLLPGTLPASMPYVSADYWSLHFNDLAHALVALFHQMVINDWSLLMDATAARAGEAARAYFIAFYATTVLAVCSVCTALVVEAYLAAHRLRQAEEKEEQRLQHQVDVRQPSDLAADVHAQFTPPIAARGSVHKRPLAAILQACIEGRGAAIGYRLQLHRGGGLRHTLDHLFGPDEPDDARTLE